MEILLEAYLDSNFGDDLFMHMLLQRYPDHRFYLMTSAGQRMMFSRPNLSRIDYLDAESQLERYGAYVFVGGDFFSPLADHISRYRRAHAIRENGGHVFILGCSLNRTYTEEEYRQVNAVFSEADFVSFRDEVSYRQCVEHMHNVHAVSSADMSFLLHDDLLERSKRHAMAGAMGISVRKRMGSDEDGTYSAYIREIGGVALEHLCADERNTVSFLALSTGEWDDRKTARDIITLLPENLADRVSIKAYEGDIEAFMDDASQCESFVCTRFHSLCLSILFGKPFVPISYEVKIENLLKTLGYDGFTGEYGEGQTPIRMYRSITTNRLNKEKLKAYCLRADTFFEKVDLLLKPHIVR